MYLFPKDPLLNLDFFLFYILRTIYPMILLLKLNYYLMYLIFPCLNYNFYLILLLQMSLLVNLFFVIQLYPRENVLKNTLLVLVMLCLAFIGLSRLMSPNLFSITFRDFWSLKFFSDSFSGSNNLSSATHALLSVNLFFAANICLIAGLQGTLPIAVLVKKSFFHLAIEMPEFFLIVLPV